jgi:ATP-binding cassette, subfamily B, bacterial PglK
MKLYLHQIFYILGAGCSKLPKMIVLFIILSIFDLIGIGLIAPYIALLLDPTIVDNSIFSWSYLPKSQVSLLILISFILIGVFLLKAILAIWVNYVIVKFSANQQVRLRSELMKAYQLLPYTTYLNRNSSEYIHSTQTLVNHYTNGVLLNGMKSLSDGIVAIVLLTFLVWVDLYAFLLIICLLGSVLFIYDYFFRKDVAKLGADANNANTKIVQSVHEGIEGLKEVRVLGRERFFYNQVVDNSQKYALTHTRATVISSAPRYLFELVIILFIAVLVLYTLYSNQDTVTLLTTLSIFGVAAIRLLPAANIISNSLIRFRLYRDSVARLYNDIKELKKLREVEFSKKTRSLEKFKTLSLREVSFLYQGAKENVLLNITLDINSGDSIGFIGSSGSGKTTLIDVILGLLEPQEGVVLFNGKKLQDNIDIWRSHVAYIPQQVFLIDNTLRQNIALGTDNHEVDDEKVNKSLKMAKLSSWVETLEDGINTKLGERGIRLSGGQRQRIALARAFYHERDVLVMDEATSALDDEIEQEIVKEIEALKGKVTLIVIAHRLSTIAKCDRIYRIEKGVIVAAGKPEVVLGQY